MITSIQDLVGEKIETVPSHPRGVSKATVGKNETVQLPEDMEKMVDETRAVITPQQPDQFRQLLDEHKTLRFHLNRAHSMELLSGCPRECFYFHFHWSDVWKHCQSHHALDINTVSSFGGCMWGLTV